MTLRRLELALVVAAAAVAAFPTPAGAVDQLQVGVWWRAQQSGTSLPTPPHVPSGGLWVSSDPSGPSAVSAIRFALAPGESAPTLVLNVSQLTAPPATPATPSSVPINACVTTAAWSPTGSTPGAWASQPSYDCSKGAVQGQMSADQKSMVFDLAALDPAGTVDVLFVPGSVASPVSGLLPAPAGGNLSPAFDATFKAPQAADISVVVTSVPPPPAPIPYVPRTSTPATLTAPVAAVSLGGGAAAPPPVRAPQLGTPRSAPPSFVPGVIRRIVHFAASPISLTLRHLAIAVLAGLAVWAWQLRSGDALGVVFASDPEGIGGGLKRRFGTGERVGKPPSLR